MSLDWIVNPIFCDGAVVCAAVNSNEPLLPLRGRLAFRAILLFNAWQAHACDGRQMSYDDFDRMEDFEAAFSNTSQNETAIHGVVDEFGDFIPAFLAKSPVEVPKRALVWTQQAGYYDA